MRISLAGLIAPLDPHDESAAFHGRVWFDEDGSIAAVTADGQHPPAGVEADRDVDAGNAFVYPGLIDLHSHLGYNTLPLWTDPAQATAYLHHDIWPGEPTYADHISWPGWTLLDRAPECVLAYVQVRALAGGTTSIQGWPNVSRPPTNALVRSIEKDRIGPLEDPVIVSALTESVAKLGTRATGMANGQAFVYHCAEGQPGSLVVREFIDADTAGCLGPRLAAIHCCALDATHFALWKQEAGPGQTPAGTVVWSPFSNLWLYGITTDIQAVRSNDLNVCLGTDWGPSGTKNLLGEIKVARIWSDRQGWNLTDLDLAKMVSSAPGDFLASAWGQPVGRLVNGGLGDATVVAQRHPDAWTNLVAALDTDVQLVLMAGRARYGTYNLMRAAGEPVTTRISLGRIVRRVVLNRPDDPSQPWSWADLTARMDAVRADAAATPPTGPAGRRPSARTASPMVGDPPGTPAIVARPDMPGAPAQAAGPPPAGRTVQIPPLDPIYHSPAWLSSISGGGFHGGVLDALAGSFREDQR